VALPQLLAYAVYTWLIGNGDAHGKNISLLIDTATGKITLAPLYDTVPTALWPDLRPTTAMSVNGKFTGLGGDDLIAEARRWGLGNDAAWRAVTGTCAAVQGAIQRCTHEPLAELVEQRTLDLLATLG
jgi:serine/threonine-protein kinase HipA